MPSDIIQWFPGHMAKTRRLICECLSSVDIIIEVLDARIPHSSKNPEIARLIQNKPELILLNKSSLADPSRTAKWIEHYSTDNSVCTAIDCISGDSLSSVPALIRDVLAEKVARYNAKGMSGRRLKAMMVGIPNVGKSSLINRLANGKRAKVEDRPGVTVNKQWISTSIGLDLLDMPGVLWPKFDSQIIGQNLAMTGAIKDAVVNIDEIAMVLCERLRDEYPRLLCERYKLSEDEIEGLDGYDIFQLVGKKRGFLMSGGVINEQRTAEMLLDEFRAGKIGRITLEMPRRS